MSDNRTDIPRLLWPIALWAVLVVVLILLLTNYASKPSAPGRPFTLTDFANQLELDNVATLDLEEASDRLWNYTVVLKEPVDGATKFEFLAPDLNSEYWDMIDAGNIAPVYHVKNTWFPMLMLQILPIIIILGVFWFFMFRWMQAGRDGKPQ